MKITVDRSNAEKVMAYFISFFSLFLTRNLVINILSRKNSTMAARALAKIICELRVDVFDYTNIFRLYVISNSFQK
jgi:hypothetical protein